MNKKIFILTTIFMIISAVNVFSYSWVEDGKNWYVVDETTGEFLNNVLLDVGDNVYYLDGEGKMITGWWRNSETGKYYYFSNRHDKDNGGMLFGLHTIDGYYRYFADDGSLVTSDEKGSYVKAYGEYYADSNGKLYYANELMRDVSENKSEYYSNSLYYTNDSLNNFFLANFDAGFHDLEVIPVEKNTSNTSNVIRKRGEATGGTNYTVDNSGTIHVNNAKQGLSALEKIGPSANK